MGVYASTFFSKPQQSSILAAIKNAEINTSGEIRVHIENKCPGNVLDRAAYMFGKLRMQKTALRNGVLFYLAVKNRRFAIIGDAGINAKVPENFWDNVKNVMQQRFTQGEFAEGLIEGITQAGEQLRCHFPFQKGDINEQPDEISSETN